MRASNVFNVRASVIRRVWSALLIGCMSLGWAAAANAQRSTPVKNVDEPGRDAFDVPIEFSSSGCLRECTDFSAFDGTTFLFNGPVVPDDKRLVVRSVSARLGSESQYISISFQSSRVIADQNARWAYFGPYFRVHPVTSSATLWGMTSDAFFTIDPGEPIRVRVRIDDANGFVGYVAVSGYFIDAE
ncbi:MAG: hypothetical protein KDK91_16570 [Gammaproteobacteria bacterium]|nr:hypothetical protein [Gammaproteobacteria bacterium]